MHRRQTSGAKGWGMTLRSDVDWALADFAKSAPHSNFTAHYGADGSGDLTRAANADAFVALVGEQTKQRMLALVLADGVRFRAAFVVRVRSSFCARARANRKPNRRRSRARCCASHNSALLCCSFAIVTLNLLS